MSGEHITFSHCIVSRKHIELVELFDPVDRYIAVDWFSNHLSATGLYIRPLSIYKLYQQSWSKPVVPKVWGEPPRGDAEPLQRGCR